MICRCAKKTLFEEIFMPSEKPEMNHWYRLWPYHAPSSLLCPSKLPSSSFSSGRPPPFPPHAARGTHDIALILSYTTNRRRRLAAMRYICFSACGCTARIDSCSTSWSGGRRRREKRPRRRKQKQQQQQQNPSNERVSTHRPEINPRRRRRRQGGQRA